MKIKTILNIIQNNATEFGTRTAFHFLEGDVDTPITYEDIWNNSRLYAAILKRQGLVPNDKVIILTDQSQYNIYSLLGTLLAEGIFTVIPVPTDQGKINRLQSVIQSCKPRYCIITPRIQAMINPTILSGLLGNEIQTICLGEKLSTDLDIVEENWVLERDENELIYIQYTSGSTSSPKGIGIHHRNLMESLFHIEKFPEIQFANLGLSWIPFYHNLGLFLTLFRNLYIGQTCYIMNPMEFLKNPLSWLFNCSKYKVNYTLAPNSALALCATTISEEQKRTLDLHDLKHIMNGSEPVNLAVVNYFLQQFVSTGLNASCINPGYGLGEVVCGVSIAVHGLKTLPVELNAYRSKRIQVTTNPVEETQNLVSLGTILDNLTTKIVNPDTKKICAPDEIGELWISGSSVSDGYYGISPEEDPTFHQKLEGDDNEYLRTGDLGIIYKDELYITGRLKEVIIINGHNIFPNDIENDLHTLIPAIAANPISMFQTSIEVKERFILCIEGTFSNDEYSNLCTQIKNVVKAGYQMTPYQILFLKPNTLPRTDNGKIKNLSTKQLYLKHQLPFIYSNLDHVENTSSKKMKLTATEETVKEMMEQILKVTIHSLEDDFLELGGNSFDTTELAQRLATHYNISLELSEVLNFTSLKDLAALVDSKLNQSTLTVKDSTLEEDAKLPSDISLEGTYTKLPSEIQTIFVTGVTGFLGAYLIQSYMEQSQVSLFCHVRALNEELGMERIVQNMKHYKLWKESYRQRLTAVPGDLCQPKLGLSDSWYERIAKETDLILHNGAILHFLYPYKHMKKSNITSTIECIRLACKDHPKYLGYVSSYSVFDNPSHFQKTALEGDPLESCKGYYLHYSETKWVSEKLLQAARERGLKTFVFRPGEITGSPTNGLWKVGDLLSRSLIACMEMGMIPTQYPHLYMTPVDYVGSAIAYITRKNSAINKSFHLINLNLLPLDGLLQAMRKKGIDATKVEYSEWQNEILHSSPEENSLSIMESLFHGDVTDETCIVRRYSDMEAQYDTTNTDEILSHSGISCPPMSVELMEKYIDNFIAQGYLKDCPKIIH